MRGSIRKRGTNSWEIRIYAGTDPDTGRRRQLSRTVRGSRTQAQRELRALAAFANVAPTVGARATLAELLDRWFAVNEPNWAATTVRSTRSIIDGQLKPKIGHVLVRELTTVMIDDFYASLRIDVLKSDPVASARLRDDEENAVAVTTAHDDTRGVHRHVLLPERFDCAASLASDPRGGHLVNEDLAQEPRYGIAVHPRIRVFHLSPRWSEALRLDAPCVMSEKNQRVRNRLHERCWPTYVRQRFACGGPGNVRQQGCIQASRVSLPTIRLGMRQRVNHFETISSRR